MEKEFVNFSTTGISKEHKLFILKTMQKMVARSKKPFGLLVILGWQEKWRENSLITDTRQNIFQKKPVMIFEKSPESVAKLLKKTKLFDGALLIRKDGTLCDSGIYLTGLEPGLLIAHLGIKLEGDLSSTLGFREPVHSRHLIAITASWQFSETTVYTISEETKVIRIYENGRIIYSTILEEVMSFPRPSD